MTDNEIIKALQRMSEEDPDGFSSDVLDLVNRQKAEIERLQSMNQAKLDMIHDIRAELETAKSEAIREFAERLKSTLSRLEANLSNSACKYVPQVIDNLVRDMTEGGGNG